MLGRLGCLAFRGLVALGPETLVRLSGRPPIRLDGETLEPEIQLLLALLNRRPQSLSDPIPAQIRSRLRRHTAMINGSPVGVGAVLELTIPGPLRARHYIPAQSGPHPLMVYFHGGGFVAGDLDTHDNLCRILCRHAQIQLLSVEYRLAPEHPFPAAINDGQAALTWALDQARQLGADPARIGVGGDSPGGAIAAVVSQRGARGVGPPAAFQLLLYPPTDCRAQQRSYQTFAEGFVLTRAQCRWCVRQYVQESQWEDPEASPLLAPDLTGLPPTLMFTAGFDVLRDEAEDYSARMQAAGVYVHQQRLGGLIHSFASQFAVSPASHRALLGIAATTRTVLRGLPSERAKRAGWTTGAS